MAVTSKTGYRICPFIYGTLNLLSGLSFLCCNTSTPPQTNTKAKRVPILVKESTSPRFRNKAGTATTNPVRLAADYLNLTLEELVDRVTDTLMQEKLLKDIHKLAGSVPRQVESSEK